MWGTVGGGGLPQGNWNSMTNPVTSQPVNLSFKLTTAITNPPPQTNCCPETNGVKWVQPPNLINGVDVDASWLPQDPCDLIGWVLADDFLCTNTGPITDIHLWGSWLNDQIDPNAQFTLAIYSDVPTNAVNSFSHPGNKLWSQIYLPGQYNWCVPATVVENFTTGDGCGMGITTNLCHLCFPVPLPANSTNTFYQTGTIYAKTNYWLSVMVQGTNFFGWKTSTNAYNDYAVGAAGVSQPGPGDWFQIDVPFQPNMAFMIVPPPIA